MYASCNLFENETHSRFSFLFDYAMIHIMPNRPIEPKRTGLYIRPRYIVLFFTLVFFVLGGVFLSQQTKLTSIADEKKALQTELDQMKVDEERLECMLEYMQTTDYKIQYAREKLGYVFHDDWKFYDDSANVAVTPKFAETPTPLPTLTTPAPSAVPSSTPAPTPDDSVAIVTMGP